VKTAKKSTTKITASETKAYSESSKSGSSLNKKSTSLKPKDKDEAKKGSNNHKEHKAQKPQEAENHKENKPIISHPERVNTNTNANTNAESSSKGKTVATETATSNAHTENKAKVEKTSAAGFFTKTSKTNQSTAGKAFAAFIGGFILFYLSIVFICKTERDSVVETKFIDWIDESVKFVDLNGSSGEKDLMENIDKPILIQGKDYLFCFVQFIIPSPKSLFIACVWIDL